MSTIDKQEKFQARLEHYKTVYPKFTRNGAHYGYPVCCIVELCFRKENGMTYSSLQIRIGKQFGFMPCIEHALDIHKGKLKLEDLILPSRTCKYPFPNDENDLLPE